MSAARRKGKWIGGHPVLGYDIDSKGGRIIVNPAEAEQRPRRQESANSGPPDQVSAEGSPSQIPRIAQLLARAIKFETMVVSSPQASTPANVRYDWAD